jgi:cysteine desulfurase
MINFDSNNFSLLSTEVSMEMYDSIKIFQNFRTDSFGKDQHVKAQIEKARYKIAELVNSNAQMLFFNGNQQKSEINLILILVQFLDVKEIITSVEEHNDSLSFLENLTKQLKIKLRFINSPTKFSIDKNKLINYLSGNNKKKLVSLPHANRITGELLPVKDIANMCKENNALFHLDTNLTINKYKIDFAKLLPDFMSFSSNLVHGPEGIGALIINPGSNINTESFNLLYQFFKLNESSSLPLISGFTKAIQTAFDNLENYRKTVNSTRQYFYQKLIEHKLDLLAKISTNKGLINHIPIVLPTKNYGKYIREKLELSGIAIKTYNINGTKGLTHKTIVPIAINDQHTTKDIDYFIETLENLRVNASKIH